MKIKLSKNQWKKIGKKAGWIEDPANNSLREKSQKWWGSLSINQMKELTKKYYSNVTWSFVNEEPGLIENIYNKENK